MTTKCVPIILLLILAACIAGCGHYVNIPPQQGDFAFHNPNRKAPSVVMLLALQKVLEDQPIQGQFQVIMPVGTTPQTYATILPQLGENAMWSSDGQARQIPMVMVDQIRIRTTHAQVDVIRPYEAGKTALARQLVTVYLKYDPISKWYVTRMKQWRGDGK